MKIKDAFKTVVKEAASSDPVKKESSSFANLGGENEDSSSEGDEPTSMAQAFTRFREKSKDEQRERTAKKPKKQAVTESDDEIGDIIKLSVPKDSEKKKKAPKKEKEEQEPVNQDEEEGEEETKPQKKTVIPQDDEQDDAEEQEDDAEKKQKSSQLSEAEEKALKRLLAINPDDLVSSTGQPISKKVAENIKALKQHLEYFAQKAKKLETTIPDFDPRLKNNYEQLRTAHEELKKKYQDRYFEETPEWEEQFVKPLKNASVEMAKWLKSHDIEEGDEDGHASMQLHRAKIEEALTKGDDVMYYEHVDAIAEMLKKGAATRFHAAAPALWDAFQKKEEAYKNKDEARKKIRESSSNVAEEEVKKATTTIDSALRTFEAKNSLVIDAYKNDPRFKEFIDYDETVVNPLNDAKEHLAVAVKRRTITPALTDLVVKGVLFNLKEKEHQGLFERIRILEEERDNLERKLERKEQTLGKVKPSRSSVTDDDDDDEDTDEPKSFTEHFKRKRSLGLV